MLDAPLSAVIIAFLSGTWALVSAVLLAWLICSNASSACKRCKSLLKTPCAGWRSQFLRIGMSSDVQDESMRRKVRQRADEERIRRASRIFLFIAISQSAIVVQRELGTTTAMLSAKDDSCLVPFTTEYVVWSVEIFVAVLAFRPALMTKKTLWALFALVMLLGLVELALTGEVETSGCSYVPFQEIRMMRYHMARIVVALIIQDSPFIIFMQFIALPPSLCVIAMQSQFHVEGRAALELAFSGTLCVLTVAMERATTSSIHLGVQAESSRAFEIAAFKLLSSMCDAVVRLSDDFQITKDCPRLSTLLLRTPGTTLQADFCGLLMHNDDKEAFKNFMTADHTIDSPLASTIHVTLRDAYSTPVLVELFHTKFKDAVTDDEVHIVGLRDVGEERHVPPAPDSGAVSCCSPSYSAPLSQQQETQRRLGPISESSIPDTASSSGDEWSFRVDTSSTEDGVKLWVDSFADGWPLLQWSLGFSNLVGLESLHGGASLLEFFPSASEQKRIGRKLQHLTNIFLYGSEDEQEVQADMELSLKTRHWGIVKVTTTVQLDLAPLVPGVLEGDVGSVAAVFEFTNMCRKKTRPRRGSTGDEFVATMPPMVATPHGPAPSPPSPTSSKKSVVAL